MAGRILTLAFLLPLTFAFSDTFPVVAWSSHKSKSLDVLSSVHSPAGSDSNVIFESILSTGDICDNDAIVLVDQPGLHASDLRALSPSSPLTTLISRSPSSIQLPYVRHTTDSSIHDFADSVSTRCGSRILSFMPGQGGTSAERESRLVKELESVESTFPKYLVIFTGSPSHSAYARRQSEPAVGSAFGALQQPGNSTLPEGGILKRYQLLTPALITSLLVVFFILLPVVFFGVSALASIQSPLHVEAPKGFNAQERKNQ
ncbi:hypothetical protein EW146_g2661 [Bondarzewia mesenterica]|uniref:Protein BIG1 n=1 Tax=Bondarzewia mesenterica TaxID=1095465 RepID=A0A4S4M1T0_9AGAM|nr:hypothetical protein EW146_g2661 [Bondarzewia mesenterica]